MTFDAKKIDVLTVGYYADFARFFNLIAKSTQRLNNKLLFSHVNLHVSGQVYSFLHRQRAFYLPCQAHKICKEPLTDKEKDFYRQFISYHIKLVPELPENKLLMQARNYYIFLEKYLAKAQPKVILLSGDSRMPAEIFHFLAEKMNVKVMHFEQAPLGKTMLDPQGVNANCSFRNVEVFASHGYPVKPVLSVKREKWQGYKKYRAIDILIEKCFPALQSIEQQRPVRNRVAAVDYEAALQKTYTANDLTAKKIFLLVLQVPDDVNMIYHSPWFCNHADIVKAVHQALPDDAILIVREHPLYQRLYESSLYRYISENQNIFFDQSATLSQAISGCNIVIVNNSTVGLESIELGKPVVVLGNAYYDQSAFCIKYQGENLGELLQMALNKSPDDEVERARYLSFLFNDVFIDGHFRDLDGPAPAHIAKWIHDHVI